MNAISKELELPGAFLLGAAGAPSRILGMNAEVLTCPLTLQAFTGTGERGASSARFTSKLDCLILSANKIYITDTVTVFV